MPLITIGITCYNAENTIARAVGSAIMQSYPRTEIVIVDDCSTDASMAIAEDFIKNHPDARIIRHESNGGPGGARQTILQNAQGEFVVFFDDDDESLPERVQKQYERLVAYESARGATLAACYASGVRRYPNGYEKPLRVIGMHPVEPSGPAVADYLLFYRRKKGLCYGGTPTCALMARKSTFDAVGGFDPAFRRIEDIDFAVRLALAGGHFIGCPESLLIQHATESADKAYEKNMKAEIQLADKHKTYLESVNRYDYARLWPLLRYHHFRRQYGDALTVFLKLFIRYPVPVLFHFLQTAPSRVIHEIKMHRKKT